MLDFPAADLSSAAAEIIASGKFLAAKGWAPATAGNYSVRLADGNIAITVSGYDKGELTPESIMLVDAGGKALDNRRPSAETLLHVGIYQSCPDCHAILHTHSRDGTVLTKRHRDLKALPLTDYELLKIYPGIATHEAQIDIPVFNNTQDMAALKDEVAPHLPGKAPVYLIRGHGLYGWGRSMTEARRVIEATEFMLSCELDLRKTS